MEVLTSTHLFIALLGIAIIIYLLIKQVAAIGIDLMTELRYIRTTIEHSTYEITKAIEDSNNRIINELPGYICNEWDDRHTNKDYDNDWYEMIGKEIKEDERKKRNLK